MISSIVSSESRPNGRGQAFRNTGTAADCVKKHLFTAFDSTEIQQFKRNSDISGSGSQGTAYGGDGCSGNAVFWWARCTNCQVDARFLRLPQSISRQRNAGHCKSPAPAAPAIKRRIWQCSCVRSCSGWRSHGGSRRTGDREAVCHYHRGFSARVVLIQEGN